MTDFTPTRAAGLARLADFVPQASTAYARRRNFDLPGHAEVSRLSPWLRHRLITEAEVIAAVTARHGPDMAGKFLSEIGWRLYFKGWMELRPGVWEAYGAGLRRALDRIATEEGLRSRWEAACRGETGIADFDHWAREIAEDGYLHNHARMWFASIWIFTLELPWELGADFFLRHLADGDPAVNTLSWRWVGGMQTKGRTYLARPGNISRYTKGRHPKAEGLATKAPALEAPPDPPARQAPEAGFEVPEGRVGLLLHDDDLGGDRLLDAFEPARSACLLAVDGRSPLKVSPVSRAFAEGATRDALTRVPNPSGPFEDAGAVAEWASGLDAVVTPYAPAGPAADVLTEIEAAGVTLVRALRPFDARAWPHATHGFYRFRKAIPEMLDALGV